MAYEKETVAGLQRKMSESRPPTTEKASVSQAFAHHGTTQQRAL